MTEDAQPPRGNLKIIRILLWALVAVVGIYLAVYALAPRSQLDGPKPLATNLGGPFSLTGGDGKPFSSAALAGKPYAIYFGYTRCGDVCPTTLARLTRLRGQAGGDDAFAILFVTIDPTNDGPKEVGQYAELFGSPIIGLTGSQAQIDRVKKQYGIFAAPEPMQGGGMKMDHTATVLLFDRDGKLAGTIATDETDQAALAKLKHLTA